MGIPEDDGKVAGPSISGAELQRIYANRFNAAEEYRNQVWRILIDRWFQKHVGRDGVVLDLGCGYGQFINNVRCGRKYAMDLNPLARSRLNEDVTFLEQDSSSRWALPDASLDLVFTSNFFEHLPSKGALLSTLAEARRCLKEDGAIIALGPNIKYLGGSYWDFYDHCLPLTELSIQEAFCTSGFRIERVIDRFLPYTMVNERQYSLHLVRAYLRLPLAWKVFGKQFLVMAIRTP